VSAADLVRLRNQYRTWSTEDLVRIVARREDYRPEAVQVVREVLADRDPAEIATATAAVQRERQEQARSQLGTIFDSPYKGVALAVFGGWLAFMVGLWLQGPISFGVTGAVGAVIVALGFAAASRCRVLPQRSHKHRARLVCLSLAVGAGAGLVNLGANWGIARADPALRAVLVERFVAIRPLSGVVAAPLWEEVAFRLFVMSVMAWLVYRQTKRPGLAFALALIGSAVIHAAGHLERPLPSDTMLTNYYVAALMIKYTALGLLQGWVFWRWGLPYAIICHGVTNATHLALQSVVF
jgi:hypothetical protein